MPKLIILYLYLTLVQCSTYRSKLLDIHRCPDPKPPYGDHKKVDEYIAFVKRNNTTVFYGNATYLETCDDCTWSAETVKLNKKTRKRIFRVKDMDCKHLMIQVIYKVSGIPVNMKNCHIPVGTYAIPEMDIDSYEQKLRIPFRNTGSYEYIYNYHSPKQTHSCWVATVSVELNSAKRKLPTPKRGSHPYQDCPPITSQVVIKV